jgi:hypothetical protein
VRRLSVDVSKNVITAASSQEGEFDTSTATEAPFSASASPSPVSVLTPDLGEAATASCPDSRSLLTSFDPMSPLPPITTIFMIALSFLCTFFCTGLLPALMPLSGSAVLTILTSIQFDIRNIKPCRKSAPLAGGSAHLFHAMPKTFDWATVGTTGRRTFVSEPHIGSSAGLMTSRFDHHKAVLMLMAIWIADRCSRPHSASDFETCGGCRSGRGMT